MHILAYLGMQRNTTVRMVTRKGDTVGAAMPRELPGVSLRLQRLYSRPLQREEDRLSLLRQLI